MSRRPPFRSICSQLSQSDSVLLQWSDEDKLVHPEAANLGASLESGKDLYKDLQGIYNANTTN